EDLNERHVGRITKRIEKDHAQGERISLADARGSAAHGTGRPLHGRVILLDAALQERRPGQGGGPDFRVVPGAASLLHRLERGHAALDGAGDQLLVHRGTDRRNERTCDKRRAQTKFHDRSLPTAAGASRITESDAQAKRRWAVTRSAARRG